MKNMLDDFEERMEMRDMIVRALGCLTERQQDIVVSRALYSVKLDDLAEMYGISRTRVSQIEAVAKMRLLQRFGCARYLTPSDQFPNPHAELRETRRRAKNKRSEYGL